MKKKLFARATTGKTKFLELETEGAYLITRWGYIDGKQQETRELCEEKNVGKSNATTPEEQAISEFERKFKKKKESGYLEEAAFKAKGTTEQVPDLSSLQKQFCPCKPIAKSPKDALTHGYLADRKYNGVNIILVKDGDSFPHIYTRRIDDITEQLFQLKEIYEIFDLMKPKSMILVELIYRNNDDIEVPEKLRALINKRRSAEAVKERYIEISKDGYISPIIFDVLFWDDMFWGDREFIERRLLLKLIYEEKVPTQELFTQKLVDKGKKLGWEGFILRDPTGTIAYTMNGKAKRTGSWKWKYEETDDFIVVDAVYGKGKHDKYFARFKLAQYDKDGVLIDCGYCGPGRLKVTELQEIYNDREENKKYRVKPYMVVEVVYRVRTKDDKLEFPVLQRIRDDKKFTECIYNTKT